VRNFLEAEGVADSQIATLSYGEERPAALGHDEISWAENRRAVLVY
jgi:peptidoglycan-associated lipoprotein